MSSHDRGRQTIDAYRRSRPQRRGPWRRLRRRTRLADASPSWLPDLDRERWPTRRAEVDDVTGLIVYGPNTPL